MSQCHAIDVAVALADPPAGARRREVRRWAVDHIATSSPDLVVLTSSPPATRSLESKNSDPEDEWRAGAVATVDALGSTRVVVPDPPPMMPSMIDCAITGSTRADCVSKRTSDFILAGTIAREVAEGYSNVTVPSTIGWFCDATGRCPEFADDTPMLADGTHPSDVASRELAPLVEEALGL